MSRNINGAAQDWLVVQIDHEGLGRVMGNKATNDQLRLTLGSLECQGENLVFNLVVTGKTSDILQQGDDMIKDRLQED